MVKREGTFHLAGLLEGPLPVEGEGVLNSWLAKVQASGLDLVLSTDGSLFSLMPRSEELREWTQPHTVDEVMKSALENLLETLPEACQRHCMSTLRSVEVLSGKERQTLYTIASGGVIQAEQRDVDAETRPPPKPLDRRELNRMLGKGAIAVLLGVLISIPFVPYRQLWERASSNLIRVPAEELRVETGPFSRLLHLESMTWDTKKRKYRLSFVAGVDLSEFLTEELTFTEKLAAEDLVRREIEYEIISLEGETIYREDTELIDREASGGMPAGWDMWVPAYPQMQTVKLRL
jgi:hypothetical protein